MPDPFNNLYASSSVMRTGQYRTVNNVSQAQPTDSSLSLTSIVRDNSTPSNNTVPNISTTTTANTQQSAQSTEPSNPSVTRESLSDRISQLRTRVGADRASSTDQSEHPSSTARCQQTHNQSPTVDIAKTLQDAKDVKQQIISNSLSLSDNRDLARSLKPVFEFLDTTISRNITQTQTNLNRAIAERDRTNRDDRTAINAQITTLSQQFSQLQSQQQSTTRELSSLTNYLH